MKKNLLTPLTMSNKELVVGILFAVEAKKNDKAMKMAEELVKRCENGFDFVKYCKKLGLLV